VTQTSWPYLGRPDPEWERTSRSTAVPPSEGNEVKWDGNQGVGTSHSTDEFGELPPAGPEGGKGTSVYGIVGGTRD